MKLPTSFDVPFYSIKQIGLTGVAMLFLTISSAIMLAGASVSSAAADEFEPMKFFQSSVALSAFSIAVSTLNECNGKLRFSEQVRSEADEQFAVVTITCDKVPKDDGSVIPASVHIVFEATDDGDVTGSVSFEYDLP